MKRKYYLRGIGVGILFATIILFTAYSIMGRKTMSDEEIMKQAEELGMVRAGSLLDSLNRSSEDSTANKNSTDNSAGDSSTGTSSAATTTENPSSDVPTTAEDETTTQDAGTDTIPETTNPAGRTVSFTIVSGMSSWNVATILQDHGVITDASDFDNYLETNGYSDRISTGEYTVTVGSDYETIAKLLTGN